MEKEAENKKEEIGKTANFFINNLEVIGKFIGTYGLAVFLVVFYVTTIYQQQQDEREEWIREITKVRYLIEPENRSLTDLQAEKVLRISTESFLQQLRSNSYKQSTYSENRGGYSGGLKGFKSNPIQDAFINILGKEYLFQMDTSLSNEEILVELNNLINSFNENISKVSSKVKTSLEEAYVLSKNENELVTAMLSQLRTENRDLKEIWTDIEKDGAELWKQLITRLKDIAYIDERQRFEEFLKRHPQFDAVNDNLNTVSYPDNSNYFSMNEIISQLKEDFESRITSSISMIAEND